MRSRVGECRGDVASISSNPEIGAAGVQALCESLEKQSTLESLV